MKNVIGLIFEAIGFCVTWIWCVNRLDRIDLVPFLDWALRRKPTLRQRRLP